MTSSFDIVILGLTITSSWGNGHATTWRSLIKGLAARGHRVLFLERDMPWYAGNRDDPQPAGATTLLYHDLDELHQGFEHEIRTAGLILIGSFVPDGRRVAEWVLSVARGMTAFFDIDTPVTLEALQRNTCEYLSEELIPRFSGYLSFTGGPILRRLEQHYGARMARPFYCSVDADRYCPQELPVQWDLGYLGTYSDDRQPTLDCLLLGAARQDPALQFVVAGPQYPADIIWPDNVERKEHLAPTEHPSFYSAQRFTLNVTRQAMRDAGYSPSVRLFEAAACCVPIISDWWQGLDSLFEIGIEILIANDEDDVLRYLRDVTETARCNIGLAARNRILKDHTSSARAALLETYWKEMNDNPSADQTRRHRRNWEMFGGLAAGVESERNGETASEQVG